MIGRQPSRTRTRWERPAWRIGGFIALLAILFIVLLARLISVQLIHGESYRAAAKANQIRLIPVAAPRGIIYDRNGKVLVRSRPSFVVGLIPSEVTDITGELTTLARTLGVSRASLTQRLLHHNGVNYVDFDQVVTYEPYGPVQLARDISIAKVARLSELLSDLPGVDLEVQPLRDYPYGPLGSHVFGYVGQITADEYKRLRSAGYSPNDVIGKDGLEYTYDRYLRGVPGGQRVVVDASGGVVPNSKLPAKAATPGDTLVTTIDWRLQTIVERALAREIKTLGGHDDGAVVVEDPWTGGILALASYPNFNPNDFASDSSKRVAYDLTDASLPLFDRAIAAANPTGSTFKMVTGSAALTEHVIGPTQVVYDSGAWDCGGYIAHDIASGGLGDTTFVPALAASSDAYFWRLSSGLGNARLRKWALLFGLAKKSGIDLPGENPGNWPTNASMMKTAGVPLEPADACFLGIGQGAMQATPLQIVNVASTVINGGTLYQPQVVRQIRTPSGAVIKT
ncbi:MAG TPA: penicillin-binding transpeptidase domain-containing protein, partial [Candidatus Baltobacteraceae bacterium]|nr:penicillin-binding transpeptidase domain-containing protein [Candidatus Baltobacteraceae bacterium]